MPLAQITLIEGRDAATKRELIARVTDAIVDTTGSARESVRVLLYEIPGDDWGVGGEPRGPKKPNPQEQS